MSFRRTNSDIEFCLFHFSRAQRQRPRNQSRTFAMRQWAFRIAHGNPEAKLVLQRHGKTWRVHNGWSMR